MIPYPYGRVKRSRAGAQWLDRATERAPEGRGGGWTDERGTSEEGSRRPEAPRAAERSEAIQHSEGRGGGWTEERRERGTSDRSEEGSRRLKAPRAAERSEAIQHSPEPPSGARPFNTARGAAVAGLRSAGSEE